MFPFTGVACESEWSARALETETLKRVKIRLIESNAKCSYLKKLTYKGALRHLFICVRPPPLLGFYWGWIGNFFGFWIWSDTERHTPAEYGLQHNSTLPNPPSVTHCLYIMYFDFGKGGRWTRKKVRGAIVHKAGCQKYQHDWLYLQSINSVKHQ